MLQGGDKELVSGGLLGQIVVTFAAFSEDKKLEIRNELQDLLFTYWADEIGTTVDPMTMHKVEQILDSNNPDTGSQIATLLDDDEMLQFFFRAYRRLLKYIQHELADISSKETTSCIAEQLRMLEEAHVS